MSEDNDSRSEVFISKRRVDSTSGYIIEQTDVHLKSKVETLDNLLAKAKEAAKE